MNFGILFFPDTVVLQTENIRISEDLQGCFDQSFRTKTTDVTYQYHLIKLSDELCPVFYIDDFPCESDVYFRQVIHLNENILIDGNKLIEVIDKILAIIQRLS